MPGPGGAVRRQRFRPDAPRRRRRHADARPVRAHPGRRIRPGRAPDRHRPLADAHGWRICRWPRSTCAGTPPAPPACPGAAARRHDPGGAGDGGRRAWRRRVVLRAAVPAACTRPGDAVLPVIRTNAARASLLRAGGLAPRGAGVRPAARPADPRPPAPRPAPLRAPGGGELDEPRHACTCRAATGCMSAGSAATTDCATTAAATTWSATRAASWPGCAARAGPPRARHYPAELRA